MTTAISRRVSTMLNRPASNSHTRSMSPVPSHLSSLARVLVPNPSSLLKSTTSWEDMEAACESRGPLGRSMTEVATIGSKTHRDPAGRSTSNGASPGGHRLSVQLQDLERRGGDDSAQAAPLVPIPPRAAATLGLGPLARCELAASLQHLDTAIMRQVGWGVDPHPYTLTPIPYTLTPDP